MNVKNLMMLLAITGLGASCSNDDYTREGSGNGTAGLSEIQLQFDNTGESQEYTKAAIASEAESSIDKLKVYLFASDAANGTYYYLETWEEGTAFTPPATEGDPNPTNFAKQESGTGWKASIYPNELKGLPYIKLLCVSGNGSSATTDGDFYKANGNDKIGALVAVTTDGTTGAITNEGAATKESDFKAAYTRNLTAAVTDIIATPLLMQGEGKTKISGSVSKVNITLRRAMARFDIDNNTSTSNLTIKTITIAKARKNASIWGETLTAVGDPDADLMTYPVVKYDDKTNANKGTTESAIYVYPGLSDDASELIITGTYKSPSTNQQVPVTYNVPIAKTADGGATTPIEIKANSRYKLHISDVSQASIYGTFEVVDWTSGGGISIKPDNDSPVFDADKDAATVFEAVNGNAPTAIVGSKTQFTVEDASKFKMTVAATGKVRAEKNISSTTKTAAPDWLTVAAPTYKEKDGVWYSTFELEAQGATGELPVDVTFINEAASYDPDLWTTLTFFGPKAAPALEAAAVENSTGNTVDFTAKTANMYNVVGGYIYVKAMCIEGTKVVVPAEFEEIEADRVTDGYYTTFKIKVKSALTDGNTYDIEFQNSKETTAKDVITVTAVAAKLGVALGDDVSTYATITGAGAAYTVKTDIDALASNNYTLKLTAPEGAEVTLPTDKWLTITNKETAAGVVSYTVALNSAVTDYTNFDLEFTNKLDATDKVTVTMNKAASKPKFAVNDKTDTYTNSVFNTVALDVTDATAAKASMYLANNSVIYVKATCSDGSFTFDGVTGLTVTAKTDNIYEIKITDATQFTAGTPLTLNAVNGERTSTLEVTFLSAEIGVTLTANSYVVESKDGDDIVYTIDADNLPGGGFEFIVNAPKGATTDLSVLDSSWMTTHGTNAGDGTIEAGVAETYKLKADDTSKSGDITITFTNAIAGGGDQKVILKKKTV